MLDFNDVLHQATEQRASDLHLRAGSRPHLRVDGHLRETDFPVLEPADTERIAFALMPRRRADEFEQTGEADFAYGPEPAGGSCRFRVSVFRQRGSVALVLRRVLVGTPGFDALGLPPVLRRLSDEPRGLLLVTGPAGSGRTTTLAAMVDHINETHQKHIVTIEDPIEVVHTDKRSIVNQREIGSDTPDFASALRRVMRQDPDVVVIGEMGDAETVRAALSAGTSHLVLSTLPTVNATETIKRIIGFFPAHQQLQVRMSLAGTLRGIVSQQLLERVDGKGRIPAVEVLVVSGRAFEKVVNPDETHELEQIITEGEYYGMQTFDQSLFGLYENGLIGLRDALSASTHPHELRVALQKTQLPEPAG